MVDMRTLFASFGIALAIGFGSGLYIAGKFEKADQAQVLQEEKKESAQAVVKVIESDRKLDAAIQKSDAAATTIKKAVAARVQKQEQAPHEIQIQSDTSAAFVCPAYQLDVGTVRLLNAARQGADLDSITGSDEALATPSGVGVAKLLDNDLEVVRMYHELAKRHDELVTEVEEKLKTQAGEGK